MSSIASGSAASADRAKSDIEGAGNPRDGREGGGSGRKTGQAGGDKKRKGELISLTDGTYMTEDGQIVSEQEARRLGFRTPRQSQESSAARSVRSRERERRGSTSTILTDAGDALGPPSVRTPQLGGL